ncbi:hypothetical protein LTR74_010655 [Friedmanniomyces endolithicus]|nr:hypothetical protein LTR74_010655 [Friedmanniomyces endolithicus]
MAQTSPDFARIATSTDRRVLLQHYTSLTLIAMILTGLVLFIVRVPRVSATGIQEATKDHSISALRESLHDLHDPHNDNWRHAVLPVLILFLSVMGFGVLFTLAILIPPYCVKGAEARLSYLGDGVSSLVTTTTARMPTSSSLAGIREAGYNDTVKSGPICYTPTCEYKPDSMASRIIFPGGLNPLYVAGLICFLCWAAPRFWKAIAVGARHESPGHAAIAAREEGEHHVDDSLCEQCLSKLCSDCLAKMKRNTAETVCATDDESADDDEVDDGWYDVTNDVANDSGEEGVTGRK